MCYIKDLEKNIISNLTSCNVTHIGLYRTTKPCRDLFTGHKTDTFQYGLVTFSGVGIPLFRSFWHRFWLPMYEIENPLCCEGHILVSRFQYSAKAFHCIAFSKPSSPYCVCHTFLQPITDLVGMIYPKSTAQIFQKIFFRIVLSVHLNIAPYQINTRNNQCHNSPQSSPWAREGVVWF